MRHTAERVAARFNVTRAEQDMFAVLSHERALAALAQGKSRDELAPVKARVFEGAGESDFLLDECPSPGTTFSGNDATASHPQVLAPKIRAQ